MPKGRLLGLGLISILPSIAAFGLGLRFSITRYLFVAVFCGVGVYVQELQSAFQAGQGFILVPFGGGLIGLALTWALGTAGLAIYKQIGKQYVAAPPARRRLINLGTAISILAFGAIGYTIYVGLAGTMHVEDAIADPDLKYGIGPSDRLVKGEGTVLSVAQYRFQRRATDPPDIQVIIVRLPSGREIALMQGVVRIGFDDIELDEVAAGQHVRFTGGYHHYRPTVGSMVDVILVPNAVQMQHEDVVVLRGVYPNYNRGEIEVLD
jgi:hypothetical protein